MNQINEELKADKLMLEGFYKDAAFTEKFDFANPIDSDTELYMKLVELKDEEKGEKNPETSDINLFLIISLAALGTLGTAVVLKNRLS